ncbi:hypothetical protein Glove_440g24 [Diversispora epigaea]|uniref:Uncharacterized protein n=1 Tax=Diversispora epigaea TaxID=1348612 RepID=A0A397GX27_9GLOM|nr:hypothetical protein Glove_440g24 [Diversispora epigaea]
MSKSPLKYKNNLELSTSQCQITLLPRRRQSKTTKIKNISSASTTNVGDFKLIRISLQRKFLIVIHKDKFCYYGFELKKINTKLMF